MPTIEVLTERAEAVSPQTPGIDVFSRFEREPDTLVIPVVENGRPVGLVERNTFLLKIAGAFGHAQYANRPILHVMDTEPAVVEAGVSIDAFCDVLLTGGPAALMRGFIVTREGHYHGVGTAGSLLQAVNELQRQQNLELVEQARVLSDTRTQALASARSKSQFLTIMSHELRTPMNGVLAVAELLRRQPLNAQSHARDPSAHSPGRTRPVARRGRRTRTPSDADAPARPDGRGPGNLGPAGLAGQCDPDGEL
jgi:two-component system, sensor histidine kinase